MSPASGLLHTPILKKPEEKREMDGEVVGEGLIVLRVLMNKGGEGRKYGKLINAEFSVI